MGSGKGSTTQQSSQNQATTQNQTSTYTPTAAAIAAYNAALSKASGAAGLPYTAYTGELVAPINAQQQLGIENINNFATAVQPDFNTAWDYAQHGADPLTPLQIQNYYNPFTQNVIDTTQANFDLMNREALNNITGNAASTGALGGSGVDRAKALYYQGALPGQEQQIAGLEQTGYQQALATAEQQKQDQANAAYQFYTLGMGAQNAALQGANAQIGAGTLEQQVQQQLDAGLLQQFYQAQAFPYAQSQFLTGATGAIAPGMGGTSQGVSSGTQFGTGTQVTTPPAPNLISQGLGLGLTGASIFGGGFLNPNNANYLFPHKKGGRVPGFDAGGAPSGGPVSYIAGVGGVPYGSVPYINPGQISPARSMQPGLNMNTQFAPIQFQKPEQQQDPLSQMKGMGDLSKLLGNSGSGSTPSSPGYYGGSPDTNPNLMPMGGAEAGDSAESIGLGADATEGAAEAGLGDTALASAGGLFDSIGAGLAGAGSAIADALPFLLLAKKGGRIKGYDDGGDVDYDSDYVPTTSGFGSVFASANPLAGVARGADASEPAGLPSLGGDDAAYQAAVKRIEGYDPVARPDYHQLSNGYGTRARYPGERIDREEADSRFQNEWYGAARAVDERFPGLDPGPRNALASLTYNAGTGWMNAGLGRAVANGDMQTAARIMQDYNHAGGKTLPGLTARRQEEAGWMLGREPGVGNAMAFAGPSDEGGVGATAYGDTPDIITRGPRAGVGREPPPAPPAKGGFNWDKLFDLGVGMMASRSPYLGVAIGEGGKYAAQQGQIAKSQAQTQSRIDNEAKRLAEEADYHRQTLANQAANIDLRKRMQEFTEGKPITINDPTMGPREAVFDRKRGWIYVDTQEPVAPKDVPSTAPKTATTSDDPERPYKGVEATMATMMEARQKGLHGQALVDAIPLGVRDTLEGIANYELPFTAFSKMGRSGMPQDKALDWVKRINPDYDAQWYNMRGQALKNFFASTAPNSPVVQARRGNTAMGHGGELAEALQELHDQDPGGLAAMFKGAKDSNTPIFSYLAGKAQEMVSRGTPAGAAWAKIRTIAPLYTHETSTFYAPGGGSVEERKAIEAPLDPRLSYAEMITALRTQGHMFSSKTKPMEDEFNTVLNAPGLSEYGRQNHPIHEWHAINKSGHEGLDKIEKAYASLGPQATTTTGAGTNTTDMFITDASGKVIRNPNYKP